MIMQRRRGLIALATLVCVGVLWAATTGWFGIISSARFPSPAQVWSSLAQISTVGFAGATLPVHIVASVSLVIEGFLIAASSGTALGLAMGWSPRFAALVNPVFQLIRPIPPLAWIPLAILWLGLGNAAKVFVIWLAAFVPAVINTEAGVRDLPKYLIEAAEMLGTNRVRLIGRIVVPGALPVVFTGLRLSLQASWTTLVAAELVASVYGLGHVLNTAQQDIDPGMIFVGMAAVGVFGWLTSLALGVVEKWLLAWHPSVRAARNG
jgi:NitT/TauT family transport system permease protein/taurine transport system permease protein